MSPSMEKERVDHQVLNPVLSGTEPDRNTLAAYQIRLAAFFGISVYKRLERCVGTHPEKLWVKIPNYFCLSAYTHLLPLGIDDLCHEGLASQKVMRFSHLTFRKQNM